MSVEIKNLTNRPVLMRLNSGQSIHLSPGASSVEVMDAELANNAKVAKLRGRHVIVLSAVSKKAHKTASTRKSTTKKTKK